MKKQLLTMFALLAMSISGAWAETTTIYERGTSGHAWAADDASAWGSTFTVGDNGLTGTGTNTSFGGTMTISPAATSIVTLTATINGGTAPGRSGSYDYITIGGVSLQLNGQDKIASIVIDGTATTLTGYTRGSDYKLSVTIDGSTGAVEYSVTGGATGSSTTGVTTTAVSSVSIGHYKAGKENYAVTVSLKDITITETTQSVTTANYTVKYLCGETEIKTSETRTGTVGSNVTLSSSDIANFITSDNTKKYIYVSDNASSTTIASDGSSIITVNFREAATYSYTAKTSLGTTLASGSNFEGETISYPYAEYLNVDGTLYGAAKQGTNPWWGKTFTLTQNNQVETVNYTATDKTNIVYFTETEDIEGATKVATGNADIRCSMQAGGFYEGNLTTLQPGKYKVGTSVWGNTGETITIKAGENTVLEQATVGYIVEIVSEEFTITEPTIVSISGGNTSASAPKITDYIFIQKTGDVITLNAAKTYSTYCSSYALDFTGNENVEAYTAKKDGNVVKLTKVEKVPAGAGVILVNKNAAASASVNVIASASALANNELVGVTEATAISNVYVLKDGEFHPVTANSTLAAGKAYLNVEVSAANNLHIVIDGEEEGSANGISSVSEAKKSAAKKFISNGQIFIQTENGTYNANGSLVK